MKRVGVIAAMAGVFCWVAVTRGEAQEAAPEPEKPKIAMLSADALRAGALAYPSFEDHVRSVTPETGELGKHLSDPSNYVVEIDDRGEYFSVAFIAVGHPDLAYRRGGGWQCMIAREDWRVVGCNKMK